MVCVRIAKIRLGMKNLFQVSFYVFIFLSLVACGEKEQTETKTPDNSVVIVEELPDINLENIKANKKALLQQMANDLYLEAEKEIKASPTVKMDERGIYDDIEPVKIDVEVPPSLKLEVPIKAGPEKTAKD